MNHTTANVSRVTSNSMAVDVAALLLSTKPPQTAESAWLDLPATVRLFLQLVVTLLLSALAVKFLTAEYATPPRSPPRAQSAPPPRLADVPREVSDAPSADPVPASDAVAIAVDPTQHSASASSTVQPPPAQQVAAPPPHKPDAAAPKPPDLRALGIAAVYVFIGVVICLLIDRFRLFPILSKVRSSGADSIIAIVGAVLLACTFTVVHEPKDATVFVSPRQTDEWKGSAMLVFLLYHYWDWKQIYNFVRCLVSLYVFFTGFGQTLSLRGKGASDPLGKMAIAVLRINLLCALLACCMGQPYMLYYICPMHTLWTGIVILIHLPGSWLPAPWHRYALAIALATLLWHWRGLFDVVFGWMGPLVEYEGSTYEWWFRSKLDAYSALAGCLLAEARPWVEAHLNQHDSASWVFGRAAALTAILGLHSYFVLGIAEKVQYNVVHPYTVAIPLVGALLLRNCGSWARSRHSWALAAMGRHSLELYLLQFSLWLGAFAKGNVVPVPELRVTSSALQTLLFCAASVVVRHGTATLLSFAAARKPVALAGAAACIVAIAAAPVLGSLTQKSPSAGTA